jgi:hypothetical protein
VPLGQNRARPICTVCGAARGHAGHGLRVRCRRDPRPRPTQRARPRAWRWRPSSASAGAARAARGARCKHARGARRRCSAPVRGKRLRGSGSPTRERRTAARRRRASCGRDGGAVSEAAVKTQRDQRGGRDAAAQSGCRARRGRLSGTARAGRGSCRDARVRI